MRANDNWTITRLNDSDLRKDVTSPSLPHILHPTSLESYFGGANLTMSSSYSKKTNRPFAFLMYFLLVINLRRAKKNHYPCILMPSPTKLNHSHLYLTSSHVLEIKSKKAMASFQLHKHVFTCFNKGLKHAFEHHLIAFSNYKNKKIKKKGESHFDGHADHHSWASKTKVPVTCNTRNYG